MASFPEDSPRLTFVPIEVATVPPAGLIEHLKDRWWSVHPTKGLIFFDKCMAPQCNGTEAIARRLQESLYPWAECRFIPSAFRRIDPRDYES